MAQLFISIVQWNAPLLPISNGMLHCYHWHAPLLPLANGMLHCYHCPLECSTATIGQWNAPLLPLAIGMLHCYHCPMECSTVTVDQWNAPLLRFCWTLDLLHCIMFSLRPARPIVTFSLELCMSLIWEFQSHHKSWCTSIYCPISKYHFSIFGSLIYFLQIDVSKYFGWTTVKQPSNRIYNLLQLFGTSQRASNLIVLIMTQTTYKQASFTTTGIMMM